MTPAQQSALDALGEAVDLLNRSLLSDPYFDGDYDSVVSRAKAWRALKDEPPDESMALNGRYCGAPDPNDYYGCTRSPHADGEHVAHQDIGAHSVVIVGRWPMNTADQSKQ